MSNEKAEPITRPNVEPVTLHIGGKERVFDISDPKLPTWLDDGLMESGGYPYDKKLKTKKYEAVLEALQVELVKLQADVQGTGKRLLVVFEGRDAAGKGGTIATVRRYLNPRWSRDVALSKPSDTERGQWYFQRYVAHFPTKGEIVTFDRSWYNRGVVEPVMGFCSPEQNKQFLREVTDFERMIIEDGIIFHKFWLNISQPMQLKRFHDRYHSDVKWWKFSPVDIAGMQKWDSYTEHRDAMMKASDTDFAPWTIVRANDKRRARIEVIRHILGSVDYAGKDAAIIGTADKLIIGGRDLLKDA